MAARTLLGVHHPALCKCSNVCVSGARVQYCPWILRGARPLSPHSHLQRALSNVKPESLAFLRPHMSPATEGSQVKEVS